MARRPAVVVNREAMSAIDSAIVNGLEAFAEQVLEAADPPDASTGYAYVGGQRFAREAGKGLVERGGYISYLDGKKVGGRNVDAKPKAMKVRGRGAVVGVGYGFPARFQEMGTVRQPPRPFLTPAVMSVVGNERVIVDALRAALDQQLKSTSRRIGREAMSAARRAARVPAPSRGAFDIDVFMSQQKGYPGG